MTRTGTKSTPVRMRATAARGRRSGPKIQEAGGSNLYKTESYRLWPNCVAEPDVVGSESKFSQAQGATARAEDVELCPKLKRLTGRDIPIQEKDPLTAAELVDSKPESLPPEASQ